MECYKHERHCVVNVYWNAGNRKWNVNTYDRDDNKWNAGNQAFSPETIMSSPQI